MFTTGTDWTTAVTDLINGIVSIIPIIWCFKIRYRLWTAAYGMLCIMSVFGFFAHGFKMSLNTNIILWCVIYICLAFLIGFYVCAVKHDIDGEDKKFFRISMILSGIVAVLIVIMLIVIPDYSYTAFSVFCLVYLVYCIVKLFRRRRKMPELNWYLAAIFVLVIGCILQSIKSIHFTILNWEFDYNSVYHFCILLFLLIQFKGIRISGKR